jgi:hypothetical protein
MNKVIGLCFATAMVGALLGGCELFGPVGTTESKAPVVELRMPDTLKLDTIAAVTGSVDVDEAITAYSYSILNSSGAVATGITVNGPNLQNQDGYTFRNQELTIRVGSSVAAGNYTLNVSVTAGAVGTSSWPFYVKGTTVIIPQGTPVTTAVINAGANGNNDYGSSIDLDAGVAYKMADAANHVSEIDLCYAYSGTASVEKIGTALWAQNSGFAFAAAWGIPTNVKFYPITMTAVEFDAITTKEQIPAFDATKAVASSTAATGNVFLVQTTSGVIALIKINSQTAGSAGYIQIKMSK